MTEVHELKNSGQILVSMDEDIMRLELLHVFIIELSRWYVLAVPFKYNILIEYYCVCRHVRSGICHTEKKIILTGSGFHTGLIFFLRVVSHADYRNSHWGWETIGVSHDYRSSHWRWEL